MALKLGADCKLYRHASGNYAVPTWDEITICQDLTAPLTFAQHDASVRGCNYKLSEPGLLDAGVEFQILRDQGHADLLALHNAAVARATIIMGIATGNIAASGEQHLKAPMKVFEFSDGQPVDGLATISVKMMPAYDSANQPVHVIV